MKISPNKIWSAAKKVIPGGNGLLSKRPERFTKKYWPTYFSKADGINIWDLNKKKYTDMSIMGIGTSTLGYRNYLVDKKVIGNQIQYISKSLTEKKIIPNFLVDKDVTKTEDIKVLLNGLKLIGDYLEKTILKPNNLTHPLSRLQFINTLK